jgi:hypothetical protein
MIIKKADLPIEKIISYATEDEIIYNDPKPKIEEAWNDLARYYTKKIEEENREIKEESEFYRLLSLSRVENETALTTLGLISQNIIKSYETFEEKEENISIRPYIIDSILGIMKNRKDELIRNIDLEKKTYKEIKKLKQEVKIENNEIRVYFSAINYMPFEESESNQINDGTSDKRSRGLQCKISYKGIVISGALKLKFENKYDECEEFFLENRLCQKFRKNDLTIEILHCDENAQSENSALCVELLKELKNGAKLKEIYPNVLYSLSNYILENLLKGYSSLKYIEDKNDTIILAENDVFRITREKDNFEISYNGKIINFIK